MQLSLVCCASSHDCTAASLLPVQVKTQHSAMRRLANGAFWFNEMYECCTATGSKLWHGLMLLSLLCCASLHDCTTASLLPVQVKTQHSAMRRLANEASWLQMR